MSVQVRVKGIAELRKSLANLPKDFLKGAERAVLRAGASPIAKAAKARAPVGSGPHSGLLKKSIGLNVKKVGSTISARIGPRKGFGVKVGQATRRKDATTRMRDGRVIVAAKKGTVRDVRKDPQFYSHIVEFGSSKTPAKPFIRPAVDAASSETLDAMTKGLEKYLDRTVKRLRKNP